MSRLTKINAFCIIAWVKTKEKVQRRTSKRVKGFKKLCYEDRLRKLNLISLADTDRSLRGDLIEAYKIITGREKVKKEDFLVFSDSGYNLRGHC